MADQVAADDTLHFVDGINQFLIQQPEQTLKRLYNRPSNCLAIFRLLPPYARHIILASLWLDSPFSLNDLQALFRKAEGKRQLELALAALTQLHLIYIEENDVELDPAFKEEFRKALVGSDEQESFGVPLEIEDDEVDIAFLDSYANERWETILHYMVGSDIPAKPSPGVLALLKSAELMDSANVRMSVKSNITSRGFQFLLEDVNRQLWDMLLQYLRSAQEQELDLVEVLSFLFMLGNLELGRAYSSSSLSETQLQVMAELSDYGLVYRKKSSSRHFYPTRLATTLTSSAPPLISGSAQSHEEKGFLIIETNYRVYAYTTNPLQIAILNLFLSLKARFPNLVIGSLTRESIKAALKKGITAEQIITFLNAHAHPQMKKQDPLLPPTVSDQIRLWELEKNRILDTAGFLYDDFRAAGDYRLVKDYAEQLGVVVWAADERMPPPTCWRLFVTEEGHPRIRDFIKRRMAPSAT